MHFDERTEKNMQGVHPDLVRLFRGFEPPLPITIIEGVRTLERQEELLKKGRSQTMNSRHLTGHAVDFGVLGDDGTVTWEYGKYATVAHALKNYAKTMRIPVLWGGDWASFKDGTHVQLTWDAYPLSAGHKTAANSKTIAAAAAGAPLSAFIPEILKALEGFSEAMKGFSEEWAGTIQLVVLMALAGFIIYERLRKLRTEGV